MNGRLLVSLAVLAFQATCLAQSKPTLDSEPLTAEQQAIYRAFLVFYSTGAAGTVNIANRTEKFEPSDGDAKGCLKGIDWTLSDPTAVHYLTSAAIPAEGYVLVDPDEQRKAVKQNDPGTLIRRGVPVDEAVKKGFAAGLFSFSEIAFSKDHHFGAFQFSFYCGGLCGHGALVIYENIDGTWKPAARKRCGFWQS
ncbi:MAG TPA: hypothetical protein VKT75_15955 [Acidobacteriaceae bacterium]|nr:hypothetical protein [Acidobacteriaceae bacterium]